MLQRRKSDEALSTSLVSEEPGQPSLNMQSAARVSDRIGLLYTSGAGARCRWKQSSSLPTGAIILGGHPGQPKSAPGVLVQAQRSPERLK